MRDFEAQLKLQAYLDGELPEAEAREVAKWLAEDQDAVGLLAELRNTRQALAAFERVTPLPESREFFWSKIEREIARQEGRERAERPVAPRFAGWRRLFAPAFALALLVLGGVGLNQHFGWIGKANAAELETASTDPGAFTYRDYTEGATLVWLSYPAENEFADTEPADTLQ